MFTSPPSADRPAKLPTSPGWVAVVDDDLGVRSALARLLRSAGLRTRTFASADEYLARPAADEPSCLVLDVHLEGGMSGLQLQAHLRQSDTGVPVVLMTGRDDVSTAVLSARAGPGGFLRKPFDQEALFDAIARSTGTPVPAAPADLPGAGRPPPQG